MTHTGQICIIGAGSIGTALGNALARRDDNSVILLSIEKEVVDAINIKGVNVKYFPNIKLHSNLKATTDESVLEIADFIFLAIPSLFTVDYMKSVHHKLKQDAIVINMAKGFSADKRTIAESLAHTLDVPVGSLKGPTFARDLMNESPTCFTFAATDDKYFGLLQSIFTDTLVYLDYSNDINGVEILSILKNIYAIAIGIADAHFDSPNLRFLLLTRAFNEMKNLHLQFGGQLETMFKYCGYGDFSLTALNDLSRNRTLGLLIGKGFFTDNISEKVVLEGRIAVNVFCEEISSRMALNGNFPIISELYKVFNQDYDISRFVNNILNKAVRPG